MDINTLKKYTNKWIALSPDRSKVLASAGSIKALEQKMKKVSKNNEVIYHHVLPINGNYAP